MRTQVGIRFSAEDFELAEALRKKMGIRTRSDVIRLGLRRLATSEGVIWPLAETLEPKTRTGF